MHGFYDNIKICGINAILPKKHKNNREFTSVLSEKKVKMQMEFTGINECYTASEDETTEELCFYAASDLIQNLNWEPDQIKVMILVTQTPSYVMPSTSFVLHDRLKLSEDCLVYDINLGCSGYTVGLNNIASILQACDIGSKGLLLVGDTISKYIDENDYKTKMMFSDGVSATALEKRENNSISFLYKSEGSQFDKIFIKDMNQSFYMDGMAVFNYTINQVISYLNEFKETYDLQEEDIDFYVFHQAQKYIIDNLVEFSNISKEKALISYDQFGNTSGASIPITILANKNKILEYMKVNNKKSCKLLLCGFGVGLSCGCVFYDIDENSLFHFV